MASPSPQNSPMPPPQAPSPMGPPSQSPAPPQSPHSPYNQQHVNGPPSAHPPNSSQPPMQNHMSPSGPPHTIASNANGGPQQHPGIPPSGHQMSPHMVGQHMPGPPGHPMSTPGPGSHQGPGGPNGHSNMPSNPQHPNMQGPPHGYMQHQIGHMPPNQGEHSTIRYPELRRKAYKTSSCGMACSKWSQSYFVLNIAKINDTIIAGRFSRHSTINDIIRRSLATAHVPAVLEPIGLARSDGKRPDGMTLIPWRLGRSLLWDATCVDTLAASHIQATSSMVGAAASSAEQSKRRKYENLDSSFIFVPFVVETLGPWGPEARALFKELSKRVIESTGDPRAGSYLGQRISLAIQRGNAASILGTVPLCSGFEDVLDFI
ncbi:jg14683 [Pararge aegeria aegeria]|uniref:Jg14683 protein n=1 Tax=Pararge aegeria aegeria TaxID=348720 RepID=A0A8S4RCY4_9NEOP|nr:jg14683 [Pararge aegeria aegeria]